MCKWINWELGYFSPPPLFFFFSFFPLCFLLCPRNFPKTSLKQAPRLGTADRLSSRDLLWAGYEIAEPFSQWKLWTDALWLCTPSVMREVSGRCSWLDGQPLGVFLCVQLSFRYLWRWGGGVLHKAHWDLRTLVFPCWLWKPTLQALAMLWDALNNWALECLYMHFSSFLWCFKLQGNYQNCKWMPVHMFNIQKTVYLKWLTWIYQCPIILKVTASLAPVNMLLVLHN